MCASRGTPSLKKTTCMFVCPCYFPRLHVINHEAICKTTTTTRYYCQRTLFLFPLYYQLGIASFPFRIVGVIPIPPAHETLYLSPEISHEKLKFGYSSIKCILVISEKKRRGAGFFLGSCRACQVAVQEKKKKQHFCLQREIGDREKTCAMDEEGPHALARARRTFSNVPYDQQE